MSDKLEERLERVIRDLLRGRRLKIGPRDAPEHAAFMAAARLAGQREAYPRMSPAFRRRLQRQLHGDGPRRLFSRRDALIAGAAVFAGAAGAGVAARVEGWVGPASVRPALQPAPATAFSVTEINPDNGTWFDAGPLLALPERQGVHFRAGAVSAVLFREGDQVRGLSAICTHLPCDLAWNSGQRTLDCPCHNRSFDERGQFTGDPYALVLPPLPRLSVKVVDGHVQVLGA